MRDDGDARRCPFVRAVVDGDELTVQRLNAADGDPVDDQALDVLREWARGAVVVSFLQPCRRTKESA